MASVETNISKPLGAERNERRKKKTTKEKIDKMVADGARNYPAYLKLIYTGDSELSSEDEFSLEQKTVSGCSRYKNDSFKPSVVSPESDKLLDPGREKLPTPVDGNISAEQWNGERSHGDHSNTISASDDQAVIADEFYGNIDPTKNVENEKEREELQTELSQVQEDIATLKAVLETKLRVAADLKQKLGLTPMGELKQSIQHLKESETYQKTNAALKSFGAFASKKMGNLRNSSVLKSVSEKVGDAYGSVRPSRSVDNIQSRMGSITSSKSENNVVEMTLRATDPIEEDQIEPSETRYNAVANPFAEI